MIPAATIVDDVRNAYSAAAEHPTARHPFPVGRRFAEELGYPPALLRELPSCAVEVFAGVSNVSMFAEIAPGAWVLDLGCGAGLDTLIAARRVGPRGRVFGVDFSEPMLGRARAAQEAIGQKNVEFASCGVDDLPYEDGTFDVALVNGIFNLNPAREAIFSELGRVVRGTVFSAELILESADVKRPRATRENWFA